MFIKSIVLVSWIVVNSATFIQQNDDTAEHNQNLTTEPNFEAVHHSGRYQSNQFKPLKNSKHLSYLFKKYGSGGVITFEGLEHLMYGLGLGQFNLSHSVEEHHPDGYRNVDEIIITDNEDEIEKIEKLSGDDRAKEVIEIKIDKSSLQKEEILVVHEYDNDQDKQEDSLEKDQHLINKFWDDKANFMDLHDPKHRHARFYEHHSPSVTCMSPMDLIKILAQKKRKYRYDVKHKKRHINEDETNFEVGRIKITPTDFVELLCPVLLTQIEKDACGVESEYITLPDQRNKEVSPLAWLYASISILIISMCGLIGAAIVPLTKSSSYDDILQFLIALAVGTLCGDALLHLLPHALVPHDDSHHHDHNMPIYLCGCAFLAALVMYSLETLLPLVYQGAGHHHSHSHSRSHNQSHRNSSFQRDDSNEPEQSLNSEDKERHSHLANVNNTDQEDDTLKPVALMVIFGDGLHNITDGLAIGAAFACGDPALGLASALAVLLHELPHELGDFALLLKTGVSIKRALVLNICSSVLSFIGMALGLIVAGLHTSVVKWIYAGTAGTFLYIALSDLIPALGKEERNLKTILLQILGILLGGLIMLAIALNEDDLRILFE